MLTKEDKARLRSTIFRLLDGIATAATTFSLHKKGVLSAILNENHVDLSVLTEKFNANEGYLNVALHILCSQGWLVQHFDQETNTITYSKNTKTEKAFSLATVSVNLLKG